MFSLCALSREGSGATRLAPCLPPGWQTGSVAAPAAIGTTIGPSRDDLQWGFAAAPSPAPLQPAIVKTAIIAVNVRRMGAVSAETRCNIRASHEDHGRAQINLQSRSRDNTRLIQLGANLLEQRRDIELLPFVARHENLSPYFCLPKDFDDCLRRAPPMLIVPEITRLRVP